MLQRYLISPSSYRKIHKYCDCIIIGSGIAGLSTAMRLAENNNIKVLTKSSLSDSTTWYAQGGIAAAIRKPDFWKNHYEDTITAGQGLCDRKAVEILVKTAPKMIEDMIEIGTNFDISEGEISLTTEGGHSYPRILHAGGDATGEELEKKLVSYSKGLKQINFLSEYFVLDILVHENGCAGVLGMDINTGMIEIHPTSNIIIASGGIGQIYDLSTNPPISTGDGIAMAYRAGAAIMDIEFIQFHPTVFKTRDSKLFLISEALRGEGAYLRDCHGTRFMVGKHPKAELAPRDIVVKEMTRVMDECGTDYVYLDATHIPESHLKIRFPNIISKLKENGLDLKKDFIKVSPAEHYLNGGIRTDYNGKTNIEGLYCCGEAAATGAHGANRLASNSLMEGLVYGWKIYKDIEKKLKQKSKTGENKVTKDIKKVLDEIKVDMRKAGKSGGNKPDIKKLISDLRNIMTRKVGILRDAKGLKEAEEFVNLHINGEYLYNKKDKDILEFTNMLTVASLIIKAASLREESRGTHQRNDFPEKDDKNWKKHIILKQNKVYFKNV
ncbi:MAG TPA: L-aspartate oxidase [Candidatus Humimicrobiaceae bacterium]|nr:L-aspartate oxidase [Candidatus Humimicrobiaceae bacterium]